MTSPFHPLAKPFIYNDLIYCLSNDAVSMWLLGHKDFREATGEITIPSTVMYKGKEYPVAFIGPEAFSGCFDLTGPLIIPDTVTLISNLAFNSCSGFTSVTIGSSVATIGEWAFRGCKGLCGELSFPSSITTIKMGAFAECSGLTGELVIPDSVTAIERWTFNWCSGFTSLKIGNSVSLIDPRAFHTCKGLKSIFIGKSAKNINGGTFMGCGDLESIVVAQDNATYNSQNNCNAIIETSSRTLIRGCKNTVIPQSVTSIGKCAFYGCHYLNEIIIPHSVTVIGDQAFDSCHNLNEITIPRSVTTIGEWAIPDSTTIIDEQSK